MKCIICNKELGIPIRSIPITMLGFTTDAMVCPRRHDIVHKLREDY